MSFYNKVYENVKNIPEGKVATYGQIAALCGSPRASRAVGYALHSNPNPSAIPCHRVVNRHGRLAAAYAFGGINEQRKKLEAEGVKVDSMNTVNLNMYLWEL